MNGTTFCWVIRLQTRSLEHNNVTKTLLSRHKSSFSQKRRDNVEVRTQNFKMTTSESTRPNCLNDGSTQQKKLIWLSFYLFQLSLGVVTSEATSITLTQSGMRPTLPTSKVISARATRILRLGAAQRFPTTDFVRKCSLVDTWESVQTWENSNPYIGKR